MVLPVIQRFCENIQSPKLNPVAFFYTALKAWNGVSISIRKLPTFHQYKKQPEKKFFVELKIDRNMTPGKISGSV